MRGGAGWWLTVAETRLKKGTTREENKKGYKGEKGDGCSTQRQGTSMGPIDAVDITHRATIEGFEAERR